MRKERDKDNLSRCFDKEERKDIVQQITKGSSLLFTGSIVAVIFGFLYRAVIARFLGPAGYGLISLGIMFLGIGTTISLLGLQTTLKRYIPQYRVNNEESKITGLVSFVTIVSLCVSIIFTVLVFLFSESISVGLFHNENFTQVLRIFSLGVPLAVLERLLREIFLGFKKVKYGVLTRTLSENVFVLVLAALVILLGGSLLEISFSYIFSLFLGTIIGVILLEVKTFTMGRPKKFLDKKKVLLFSIPLFVSSSIGLVLSWSDSFMIAVFMPANQVGLYNAAYPIGMTIGIFVPAFGSIFVPITSEFYAKREKQKIEELFDAIKRWLFLITFPLLVFILFFSRDILLLVFGSRYTSAWNVLITISLGSFFICLVGTTTELLQVFENVKTLLLFNSTGAGMNIILNLIFIPKWGIEGAAFAYTISIIYVNIALLIKCKGHINITFKLKEYLKPTLIASSSGLLTYSISHLLKEFYLNSMFILVVCMVIFLFTYFVLLILSKSLNEMDLIILEAVETKMNLNLSKIKKYI